MSSAEAAAPPPDPTPPPDEVVLGMSPFDVAHADKARHLMAALRALIAHHYRTCGPYRRILDATGRGAIGLDPSALLDREQVPFLPVRLFKETELRSVAADDVVMTMRSSGTTGQRPSRIFLDRTTAQRQSRALAKIVATVLGVERLPMIIIDGPNVVADRASLSARGAAVRGFSVFGRDRCFALTDAMQLDVAGLQDFITAHAGQRLFVFGFTSVVWQYLVAPLLKANTHLDLSNAVLVHGGGWKKMADAGITGAMLREALKQTCRITHVHDYYGMVEQTGSIHLQCAAGYLHPSTLSDVIVRRASDFSAAPFGEAGILEVLSALPRSYPGHALLTEDEAVIHGEDTCACGWKGRYFTINGRLHAAELRGCSDVQVAGA